jgi:hypothetical protein
MSNNESNYQVWNEFLQVWPVERIQSMTLEQYTDIKNHDTLDIIPKSQVIHK